MDNHTRNTDNGVQRRTQHKVILPPSSTQSPNGTGDFHVYGLLMALVVGLWTGAGQFSPKAWHCGAAEA